MKEFALTIGEPGNKITIESSELPQGGIGAIGEILRVGILVLFIASIFLSISFIIWGGIDWITAGGNKEALGRARQKILYAIFGLFVVLTAFAVVALIGNFFGIKFWKLN